MSGENLFGTNFWLVIKLFGENISFNLPFKTFFLKPEKMTANI